VSSILCKRPGSFYDAKKLCFRAPAGSRRFYAGEKVTPEQVRTDDRRAWNTTKIFYGGKRRKIRYKKIGHAYWQRSAGQRALRLIVIAPTPYVERHLRA